MTTIYVDSRKRAAGLDSDFEVDLGESLHLQSDARLAVYKIRIADSFLSTDRGRYLHCALNWALLPEGAYTGSRLAAWISSQAFARRDSGPLVRRPAQRENVELGRSLPAVGHRRNSSRYSSRYSNRFVVVILVVNSEASSVS